METSLNTSKHTHLNLGKIGEEYAAAHLEQSGYRLVAANFTLPVGRNRRDAVITAELDLVAYDGPILCFVEVKTRSTRDVKPAELAVDYDKQRELRIMAREYLRLLPTSPQYRFDIVSVYYDRELPQFELFQNAFALS